MPAGSGSLLAPLDRFYAAAGLALPSAEVVTPADVPGDVRALLTAPGPLTPRLENRHGGPLTLRVLERRRRGDDYARRVVLLDGDVPVLLGAIAVDLARLPSAVRAALVAERLPFGHVVTTGMPRPGVLLRIAVDAPIAAALRLPAADGAWIYGRRRAVIDERAAVVATIVDVLAPIPTRRGECRSSA